MEVEIVRIFTRMKGSPSPEEMRELVKELLDFCTERARKEEVLMSLEGYPELEEHQLAHQGLQDLLVASLHDLFNGNRASTLITLEKAFFTHILLDLQFENWIQYQKQVH